MNEISVKNIYMCSEDVVAREIEGELIIVPLVSGIGDMDDELFTLSETGKVIWDSLDGKTNLEDIIKDIQCDYNADPDLIEADVLGLVGELVRRGILIDKSTL